MLYNVRFNSIPFSLREQYSTKTNPRQAIFTRSYRAEFFPAVTYFGGLANSNKISFS
jgi:hypothetical protein